MAYQKTNRSAFQNFLLAKYERATGQIVNQSLPYFMLIDPSSICQLRCTYCPTGVENAAKKEGRSLHLRNRTMMTPELFDSIIEEVGEKLFYLLFYNWGEPLFNKNLPDFIRKAKTYNIFTSIHTNLSFQLSDEAIENLLASGIDELAGSIDGFSSDTYQIYRQGGNFEYAKTNLERMARVRDRLGLKTKLIWNFLVFSFNEHEIDACSQYCNEIGIVFNRRDAYINIQERPDWLPSYRKHELDSLKNPQGQSSAQVAVKKARGSAERSCSWHYGVSVINPDGAVSPCCIPWEDKYDFGFVVPGKSSFRDVWNNDYFLKSRAAFASKPVDDYADIQTLCEKCPYPSSFKNEYVPYEKEILDNFQAVGLPNDPGLEKAFKLLPNENEFVRYCTQNFDCLFNGIADKIDCGAKRSSPIEWLTRIISK